MAEEAWGIGIIVKWILILVIIALTIWALYKFLLTPVVELFKSSPVLFLTKGFKRGTLLSFDKRGR